MSITNHNNMKKKKHLIKHIIHMHLQDAIRVAPCESNPATE